MTLGLYDIDLHHGKQFVPNLDLMKVYSAFHRQGNVVRMMKKYEDEGRYNKIVYFYENPNLQIPKNLMFVGEKKTIVGYGFYKEYRDFIPEVERARCDWTPYDMAYPDMASTKKKAYERMNGSTIVRVEKMTIGDYLGPKRDIYIADHDFLQKDKAIEFLEAYKGHHNFNFLWPLKGTMKQITPFLRYDRLFNRDLILAERPTSQFIKDTVGDKIVFDCFTYENAIGLYSAICVGLYIKSKKSFTRFPMVNFNQKEIEKMPILRSAAHILKWLNSQSFDSFYDYANKNYTKEEIKNIFNDLTIHSDIRCLLKTSPKKVSSSILDFLDGV